MDRGTHIKDGKLRIDSQRRRLLGTRKFGRYTVTPGSATLNNGCFPQQSTHWQTLDLNERIGLIIEDDLEVTFCRYWLAMPLPKATSF